MPEKTEILENWKSQLRKGTIELAILSNIQKMNGKAYGYDIIKTLNDNGIDIEGNTVYPLLRRLEKTNKLIKSEWITEDDQPKKYFKITELGFEVLVEIKNEWMDFIEKINHFLNGG
jgi:DNA-binding PadR family transcriptional regulator